MNMDNFFTKYQIPAALAATVIAIVCGTFALLPFGKTTEPNLAAVGMLASSTEPIVSLLAGGFALPTAMQFAPDGRLFVAEKAGTLRVVKNRVLLPRPFVTLPVASDKERGLIGVTFDPDFEDNGYVYVYYTKPSPVKNRLSRFTADPDNPDTALAGSELVLIDDIPSDAGNHNGGAIHFGPDGMLFVAVGDGGAVSTNAQSLSNLSGKILRITKDGSIPSDNPFVGVPSARPEVWALGLRNPFTFAFDPASGVMHINDVGQQTREEINVGARGANYGWPVCEGVCTGTSSSQFTNPLYTYGHIQSRGGAAITGGAFFEPGNFPDYKEGSYYFGDYVLGWIRERTASGTVHDLLPTADTPVDLRFGPDGALYYLSIASGSVYRIGYPSAAENPPVAAITAVPTAGNAPLAVHFDGSGSVDPDGDPLTYEWNFGDGIGSSTEAAPSHVYTVPGSYIATLVVSDAENVSVPASIVLSVGIPPSGVILNPPADRMYAGGESVYLRGEGTDVKDGKLPPSAFSWLVVFHHGGHTHPFLGPLTGTSSSRFTIPTTGETAANVWYRVHMTLTNSQGLGRTYTRDIFPKKATLTLKTQPAGLNVILDGKPTATPANIVGVRKMTRTLSAPQTQTKDGKTYRFASWSQGGSRTQTISFPTSNKTFTAVYRLAE